MALTTTVAVPFECLTVVNVRLPVTGEMAGGTAKARLPVVCVTEARKLTVWPRISSAAVVGPGRIH